jgi:hypothetical protein
VTDWEGVLDDIRESLAAGREPEDVQSERDARERAPGYEVHVAGLLRRFTLMSADISARADVGPYEVGVLQQLVELAEEISGGRAERERLARLRRYHWIGRAVDVPPRSLLTDWLTQNRGKG